MLAAPTGPAQISTRGSCIRDAAMHLRFARRALSGGDVADVLRCLVSAHRFHVLACSLAPGGWPTGGRMLRVLDAFQRHAARVLAGAEMAGGVA